MLPFRRRRCFKLGTQPDPAVSGTEFVILAIAANRSQRGKYAYELPKNVSAVYELYLDDVDWSGSKKLHRKRLKKRTVSGTAQSDSGSGHRVGCFCLTFSRKKMFP